MFEYKTKSLAIVGLITGVLVWPAFGIFFGYALGDIFLEDSAEQARLRAQNQLISGVAFAVYLMSIPFASWASGRTFAEFRLLSSLTMLSVVGNITFVVGLFFLG